MNRAHVALASASIFFVLACTTTSVPAPTVAPEDAGSEPIEEEDAGATPPATDGTSGAPCVEDSDCKGTTPVCVKEFEGLVHKDGFCISACTKKSDCPGKNSVCDRRACGRSCTAKSGSLPCRDGYLCSFAAVGPVCYAEGISTCDPNKRGSCGSGKTCVSVGLDPVGQCYTACDLFTQDCTAASDGCYPSALGEGNCGPGGTKTDGQACTGLLDCAPGLACTDVTGSPQCRPLCGGPSNEACTNGKKCVDFTQSSPSSVAGVCAG